MNRALLVVFMLSLLCSEARGGSFRFFESEMESKYPDFQEDVLSDSLRIFLTAKAFVDKSSIYADAVKRFYRDNNYQLVWTKDFFDNPRIDTLLSHIQCSTVHGLNPEHFEKTAIIHLRDSLKTGWFGKGMPDIYRSFRQLEYLLTKAYIDYATGLKYGFLSPQKLFPRAYYIATQTPDSAHYADLFAAIDAPSDYLAGVQPADTFYLQLQALLTQYQDSLPYYKTVQANLERYRWKRKTPPSDKYILVNVAAFNLLAVAPDSKPLTMNVCVGKVTNQTPLLESEIAYMNLNPTWNVPASIIENEIYWAVRKDSTYLTRHRMKILRGEKEIAPDSIDWGKIDPKHFPYQIRQDPGDDNSLGRIKFMFKNPFAVYLHDTPSKRHFLRTNRAVSHGCVRVQHPMDVAYFCLPTKVPVYFDRLRASIDLPPISEEGKKLKKQGLLGGLDNDIILLSPKVPLTIDYRTIYALPDGKIYFADDVYGFDKGIRKALLLN
ncbi:hypothetical protein AGMMS4957_09010 [Bacteroidia bacterium]|nr:hypothetical protein AGMMS4957_09010 [Bacteroidia bacterium]